ncbi:MAG: hypothetical protein ACRCXB_06010 [Aeromonadaceae bacterium]
MIDLDDVAGALHRDCNNGYLLHDEIEDFVAKLRQAEKDAARYRWLRDESCHNEWHTVGGADPSVWDVIVDEYIEESRNGSNN